jgi:hypothetical protein
MNIQRCVCYDVPFTELADRANRSGATSIPELQRLRDFGGRCKLCHPYVQAMLKTGQTKFNTIIKAERTNV